MKGSPQDVPLLWAMLIGAAATAAGCGGGPTGPSITPPAVELSCPAPQTIPSVRGSDVAVEFPLATASGGTAPIAVTCNPSSGSLFSVGTSKVTCVGIDALRQAGACTFTVTVQSPPKLSATRFVAFGDSITEGKNGDDPAGGLLPNGGYPGFLEVTLSQRYATQTISITNAGCGGEDAGTLSPGFPPCSPQGSGVGRLPAVLDSDRPQVLLLLEGVNDLFDGNPLEIPPMIDALRTMLHEARSRNVPVCLATLTPERSNTPHGHAYLLIPTVNDQIRQLVPQEGAVLVDLFSAFGGSPDPYIGADGLHPNAAGYQKMAETFFDAIRANFEITQSGPDRLQVGPISPLRVRR